jgi:putative ABC transport system permease protein
MSVYEPAQKNVSKEQGNELFERIREAVSALPGVQSVSLAAELPVSTGYPEVSVRTSELAAKITAKQALVDSEYFRTFAVHLLSGRPFDSRDRENTLPVAVINKAMADKLWPREDPLGKTFVSGDPAATLTVVGIVPTGRYDKRGTNGDGSVLDPSSRYSEKTRIPAVPK